MKLTFKKFRDLLFPKKPEKSGRMTIDQEQGEFEREVLFNQLVKRGFNVSTAKEWNLLHGTIAGRYSWGALLGGTDMDHDKWDLRYIDLTDKIQQDIHTTAGLEPDQLIRSLEALRAFAQRQAQK